MLDPLRNVDIKLPTPATEDLYIKSVNKTVDSYKAQLAALRQHGNHIDLPNLDFDTGKQTHTQPSDMSSDEWRKVESAISDLKERPLASK